MQIVLYYESVLLQIDFNLKTSMLNLKDTSECLRTDTR